MRLSLSLVVVVVVAAAAGGCTSTFPPGSFDWGHGVAPLDAHDTRVQVGGGGGAGIGPVKNTGNSAIVGQNTVFGPIYGGGGGVAVEHQLLPTLLVRGEGAFGCQSPTANSADRVICPFGVYAGAQLNPERSRNFALRLRVGAGGDFFDPIAQEELIPVPYVATTGSVVFGGDVGDLQPWVDVHGGAKVGALLAPVGTAGVTGGLEYRLGDVVSLYALARTDLLFIFVLPSLTANAQAGVSFTF